MNVASLSPATLAALAKAVATVSSARRDDLTVGSHVVDEVVTLHVTGEVKVGSDYEQRVVAKADPWLLLGVALSHLNGVTVESIVAEALNAELGTEDIKARADAAVAAVKATTVTACKGKVTHKGTNVALVANQELVAA